MVVLYTIGYYRLTLARSLFEGLALWPGLSPMVLLSAGSPGHSLQ